MSDLATAQQRNTFNGVVSHHRPSLPSGTIALANAGIPLPTPSAAERVKYVSTPAIPATRTSESASNNGSATVTGALLNPNGKRPSSMERQASPSLTVPGDDRPNKLPKTSGPNGTNSKANEVFDLKAEEEALRRSNLTRASYGNARYTGAQSRAKKQDLIGESALRERMNRIATQFGMTMDDDAMNYIALSAEIRLRSLLRTSVSAQNHRVTSNHLRPPPLMPPPASKTSNAAPGSGSGSGSRPMWSLKITNDQNTLFDLMARQNREEEQTIRMERMERMARESEIAKARERAAEKLGIEAGLGRGSSSGLMDDDQSPPPIAGPSTPTATGLTSTPSQPPTQADSSSDNPNTVTNHNQSQSPTPNPTTPSASLPNPKPIFGAVKEPSKVKKARKPAAAAKDVSAEVAHKLSNAMAMRSAGMQKNKYAWMTGAPVGPSPLSGKKKKDKEKERDGSVDPGTSGGAVGADLDIVKDESGEPVSETRNGNGELIGGGTNTTAGSGTLSARANNRSTIPVLSIPARRLINVQPDSEGEKRQVPDDKALTLLDVVFALENEKGQNGMGSSADIVRKIYAKPGGPYGTTTTAAGGTTTASSSL